MTEVYADILDTLTTGLYNDIKYAVREYLQNAYDAIKQDSSEHDATGDDYCVDVSITKNNKIITITDNGIGMNRQLLERYTSIGGGTKNSPEFAGHKGIGKLSGLRFFDEFKVRTKVRESPVAFELHWKSGEMMKILMTDREKVKKIPYKEFIKNFFSIEEIKGGNKDAHYTQIQLLHVLDEYKDQVNEKRIGSFIKQNCPVPFNRDEFCSGDKIKKWMGDDILFTDTYINGKTIFQYYDNKYELVDPQLVEIKYDDYVRAKVWFSWVKNSANVIDDDEIRGIRFRCKGLCVGDSNLFANNCMPRGRDQFARWFTGEVVILDDKIRPSAARDRFCEGPEIWRLYAELKNKIGKELSLIADVRSEISATVGDFEEVKRLDAESKKVQPVALKKLEERARKLQKYRAKDSYGFDFCVVDSIEKYIKKYESQEIERTATEVVADPGKTEPKEIIDRILELHKEERDAYSKDAKVIKRKQLEALKTNIIQRLTASEEKNVSTPDSSKIDFFAEIMMKFLNQQKIKFLKKEIYEFLKNELS